MFHCFSISPSICHDVMGLDAMILVFWVLSLSELFYSPISPSSRGSLVPLLFCHKCGIIWISEVIDTSPHNLDSSCVSSSPAFLMLYSAYKLNKHGDNI